MCASFSGVSPVLNRRRREELWFACTGTGVSTGGRANISPLFCSVVQGVQDVCFFFFSHESAWICARRTSDRDLESQRNEKVIARMCARPATHHDLASVIPHKKREKEREEEKKGKGANL